MPTDHPLVRQLVDLGADLVPRDASPDADPMVMGFGEIGFEYAAIRKGAALVDRGERRSIEVRGEDRLSFLNNMLTQAVGGGKPGEVAKSFWLNRKGRIVADIDVAFLEDRVILDVDSSAAAATLESLDGYIIADDVEMNDLGPSTHRLALYGPGSEDVLAAVRATDGTITGAEVTAWSADLTGTGGFELLVPRDQAEAVYTAIMQAGGETPMARPAGWLAVNVARIEAGQALFMADFGPTSLPGETGLMDSRVSLTKGCYLGQEIVARMHALGNPKQIVVGWKAAAGVEQPVTGAGVFTSAEDGEPVGAVSSSTVSPALASACIGFAVVKWDHREPGGTLFAQTDTGRVAIEIQPELRFVQPES